MSAKPIKMVARRSSGDAGEQVISLAILAVGGQGGGVLTNWIVAVAEANGYVAQSTSVAGVAQRTGATIYYVEMCRDTGTSPVFTLSPTENDVDILIASELMEAGRAVMRGFTSPEFSTLIASTHRINAIAEKIAPGDGRVEHGDVIDALTNCAEKLIAFDMEDIAKQSGTIISSSLLGALAGSGALPFPKESYEDVIATGRGADASLKAFTAAYKLAVLNTVDFNQVTYEPPKSSAQVPVKLADTWRKLEARVDTLPVNAQEIVRLGLEKVTDFQDADYADEYLDHVGAFVSLDAGDGALIRTAAKYISKAMCYDDVIRVADIKTCAVRLQRVKNEIAMQDGQVLKLTEYFHPRFEEFYLGLPKAWGRRVSQSDRWRRFFDGRFDKGRRIRTNSIRGFLSLWLLAGLRPWRRKLLRHSIEMEHMEAWLDLCLDLAREDVSLAIETLSLHRLVKGYSDTHTRGMTKFTRVIDAVKKMRGRPDAAKWVARLHIAALDDADGKQLDNALKTVDSFLE